MTGLKEALQVKQLLDAISEHQNFPGGAMPPDPPSLAHAVEYHMKADNLQIIVDQ